MSAPRPHRPCAKISGSILWALFITHALFRLSNASVEQGAGD